ncbi:GA-like domain-containing protein, partial [Escherichia coli]|uniref:GA-like domain-containing protein n=1 Tax=Escherichia coli TaxID=562 RepID=UPI003EB6BCF3
MKIIFLEHRSGKEINLKRNSRKIIKAEPGEKYSLIDSSTGLAPKDLEISRSKNDLVLKSKKQHIEIIVEGFWAHCQPGEQQCFATFDLLDENGLPIQTIITQDGPILEHVLAGQTGTLAENSKAGLIWAIGGVSALLGGFGLNNLSGGAKSRKISKLANIEQSDKTKEAIQIVEKNIQALEAANNDAKNALINALRDGVFTQDEFRELKNINEALLQGKEVTQKEVDALPISEVKDSLLERLGKITGINVPPVSSGEEITAGEKVVKAQELQKQAEQVLARAQEDGVISPDEK